MIAVDRHQLVATATPRQGWNVVRNLSESSTSSDAIQYQQSSTQYKTILGPVYELQNYTTHLLQILKLFRKSPFLTLTPRVTTTVGSWKVILCLAGIWTAGFAAAAPILFNTTLEVVELDQRASKFLGVDKRFYCGEDWGLDRGRLYYSLGVAGVCLFKCGA